jgi:hypothetical protein
MTTKQTVNALYEFLDNFQKANEIQAKVIQDLQKLETLSQDNHTEDKDDDQSITRDK